MADSRKLRAARPRRLKHERLEARLALADTPLISEFLASNGSTLEDEDGDSSDWMEIHNPTAAEIDLGGWHLTDDADELTKWSLPAVTLEPGGYLIVFASSKDRDDPDGALHTNFRLGAGGEYLGLVEPDGETVAHAYGPAFPPQARDVSYGLDAAGQPAFFATPTPGSPNGPGLPARGAVVINEVMYHPASRLVADEFIELHNAGSQSVSLAGWQIADGVEYTFGNVTLAAGGYLVVAADRAAFADAHPTVTNVVGGWEGRLSNSGETIRLEDATGATVDQVTYADEGGWSFRERGPEHAGHRGWVWSDSHDGAGSSLELITASLPNDVAQNWLASVVPGGTPGAANSVVQADAAPLIAGASHSPTVPGPSDLVTVTARVIDEQPGSVSVSAHYRVDGVLAFTALAMRDDGRSGDGVAGDGIYGAILPAHPDLTVIEFFIEAIDMAGQQQTAPRLAQPAGEQLTNYLYQVDGSFDPNASWSAGELPTYRLIMTEAERAELEQIGSNAQEGRSRARMNGTLVSLDENGLQFRYNVGIRNRGQSSRARLPNSYHVDVPSDREWNDVREFNLNTQFTHLQLLGMQAFQAAGLVAEGTRAVRVRVNGADLALEDAPSFGVYVHLEAANSEFAANHFPGDDAGNLYRVGRGPGGPLGDLRELDDEADYRDYYEKQTNGAEDDYSDLIGLIDVLNNSPDETFLDELRKAADVEQWLSFFAANTILNNQETNLSNGVGDDYLLYRGVNDPRFVLIPHDFDSILGQGSTLGEPTGGLYHAATNPVIERFLLHPEILPQYHQTLKRLLETTFSRHGFEGLIEQHIRSFAPAEQIEELTAFLDARRDYTLQQIAAPLTANSALPLLGGYHHTTADRAAVNGTAPLAGTRSVLVNGVPGSYDPTTGEWQVGEPGQGESVSLISAGSEWQYLDAGRVPSTSPGADWRVDDPMWTDSGPAPLGYGDGDEATTIEFIDTDPDQSGTQRNITTYFRRTFQFDNAAPVTDLRLRLLRDDGAVIYINGAELRSNMPEGPIDDQTRADSSIGGSAEDTFVDVPVDPSLLVEGENVLAVEIHQTSSSSSDISFDLELQAIVGEPGASSGVPLRPGVNRLVVEAFDGPNGTGHRLDATHIDIWYDDGEMHEVAGEISADTRWEAAAGPFHVTGTVNVVQGATLTIEPGTTVFFSPGTALMATGGRILAEGTPYERIRLAALPSSDQDWDGLILQDAPLESRFRYVDQEGGDATGAATTIDRATALFEYVSWIDVSEIVLDAVHPTLTVRNSVIPAVSGDETIHLSGLDQGEQFVFEGNIFGINTSGGDVVDVGHSTLDPPTIYFLNNVFLGGLDDGIDTDGFPAVIEGNTFMNFHLGSSRNTTSNAVSTGYTRVDDQVVSSRVTLRNNTFYDVDHALLLKDRSFAELTHNTIVGATIAAIQFTEAGGTNVLGPGRGAAIDGVIFYDVAKAFEHVTTETELTVHRSIGPIDLAFYGSGNLHADPLLVDPAGGDFRLRPDSPAIAAGPAGTDIGAVQVERARTLRISELHYHPHDPDAFAGELDVDADQFEFVELVNTSTTDAVDMSGIRFTEGIAFDFATSSVQQLGPGERVLVVRNVAAFQSRYGAGHRIAGEFAVGTALANGDERIRLENSLGAAVLDFSYSDGGAWPAEADGRGHSLVVIRAEGDYNSASNWRKSAAVGGSPGAEDSADEAPPGDFNGNGLVEQADLDLVLLHWGMDGTVPPEGWIRDLPQGRIDQQELDAVLLHWGQKRPTPLAAAPPTAAKEQAFIDFDSPEPAKRGPTPGRRSSFRLPSRSDLALAGSLSGEGSLPLGEDDPEETRFQHPLEQM